MRKRRTREHIIADLSVNYLERFVLRQGHVIERVQQDYGYDATLFTFDENGERETGTIFIQLKASEHIRFLEDRENLSYTLRRSDLELWCHEAMPIILVVYDAQQEVGYWLYVQEQLANVSFPEEQESLTVNVPLSNRLNEEAIQQFRTYKASISRQIEGIISHG